MTPGGIKDVMRARIDVEFIRIRLPPAQQLDFVLVEAGLPCRSSSSAAERVARIVAGESEVFQTIAEGIGDQLPCKRLARIEQRP